MSEEQYIIPATPLFPASLIPLCSFSLMAASVKCDIRWNDLNALVCKQSAGFSIFIPFALISIVLL